MGEHQSAGNFTVMSTVDATVFAVAIVDPFHRHGFRYDSGFEDLGWQKVDAPSFRIAPWGLTVGCWRRSLAQGTALVVPHRSGLHGSVAVGAAKPYAQT